MDEHRVLYLVKRSQLGDKESLGILFDQFKPFRMSLSQRFVGKGIETDEVCQQIDLFFIEAILAYDSKKDDSPVRHITSKTKRDIWTYYRKEMNYFLYDVSFDVLAENDDEQTTDITDVISREDSVIDSVTLQRAIGMLPERYKTIIDMHYFENLSQQEISELFGVNQSSVSRMIKRARKRLKEILEKNFRWSA